MVVDLNGFLRWRGNNIVVDLKKIMNETEHDDFSIELAASDAFPVQNSSATAYLCTW